MSKVVQVVTYLRDRITLWAHKTTRETNEDEESSDDESDDGYEFQEEGRGLRTERILRAIIHIPVRWFQNVYHAKQLERSLNKEHPECPVKVKVVDKLVGNEFVENTFDYGLIIVPVMFLVSFTLWAVSRWTARWLFEPLALVMIILSVILFVAFGLMFVFAAFFGYEFEYVDARSYPKRKRNPMDSYSKLA
ncbi:uncharacterized protein LOC128953949 [Oppia nitens]|uniref:uncharacterized protein LOC128953949 n=1 Tax=Oppia nitens TaxID=1686743 RepID=UPI0023D9D222|nr:uncharacterized protein LOC128953949 [Oppia nitens]